ncbi:DNA replication and repair protein RecF [Palleronia marisminoris]|uniref:DNA replication and repair protein RecF n=1 Tax=Palleronia marisminoris TaxID=315423 RepID=A0A1Y5SWG1_9RHOB|nr:DNA replication/repair protein RecF [Palleronia marisminoris]SFG94823.1 DNA replication and repair protein RecF [Palleronia marisminoris]SLN46606.1 DNA replication and repair protein RecF [Palleronia marisminoris]
MYLTRLELSHFRSHRHSVLELDSRPIAIYGPNGAGKTNLIEAVSMLSPGRGLRRAAADELMRLPESLGWRVGAELRQGEALHEIDTRVEPDHGRTVRIDGKAAPQSALGQMCRVLWLVPSMDRLWIEGADGRRRFLDRVTLSFLPGHAEASLAYEKAMRERNRMLKDQVRDPGWYRAVEAQMADAGADIIAGRAHAVARIAEAQEGAETAFPVSDLAIADPDGVPAFSLQALEEGRPRDMAAGRTLVGPHRADLRAVYRDKGVPAERCSTGEQKALLVSLILANARALRDEIGTPPLLLLDEIAAHLDATRRAALYDEIDALGAQAWMTGTGAELFAELTDRARHLEVTEEGGISRIAE